MSLGRNAPEDVCRLKGQSRWKPGCLWELCSGSPVLTLGRLVMVAGLAAEQAIPCPVFLLSVFLTDRQQDWGLDCLEMIRRETEAEGLLS